MLFKHLTVRVQRTGAAATADSGPLERGVRHGVRTTYQSSSFAWLSTKDLGTLVWKEMYQTGPFTASI